MTALRNSKAKFVDESRSTTVRAWVDRGFLSGLFTRLVATQDGPHQIALGVAIGIFFAFTPTLPIQSLLAGFLAFLFRANKLAALSSVWINNPLTIVPMYSLAYLCGCYLLGIESQIIAWKSIVNADLPIVEYTRHVWSVFLNIFEPLFLGSICLGTVSAVISYIVILLGIRIARARKRAES